MSAYLFVHFTGTESTPEHEQIYFSVSEDGRSWRILNGGKPVLISDVGENGVRDPFIIRSVEGKHFYIIATDLSIYHRMQLTEEKVAWRQCTNAFPDNPNPGSQSMVIWESEDLLNWSPARLAQVAPADAGCFWAPKGIWDKEKQAYMVVGASKLPEDDYGWLRLYRTYTKDFVTFTEAELYIDLSLHPDMNIVSPDFEKKHVFDCAFIESGERYYRFYKTDRIQMDAAQSLSGKWTPVSTNIHSIAPNHEGPTICQENDKDSWMLMLDNLTTRGGYQPFVTDNLQEGQFKSAAAENSFPEKIKYRHGSLLPISQEEYERLVEKF